MTLLLYNDGFCLITGTGGGSNGLRDIASCVNININLYCCDFLYSPERKKYARYVGVAAFRLMNKIAVTMSKTLRGNHGHEWSRNSTCIQRGIKQKNKEEYLCKEMERMNRGYMHQQANYQTMTKRNDVMGTETIYVRVDVHDSNRYDSVRTLTEKELEERKVERIPKNTRKQNCLATKYYEEWAI
ncbi:hypothetical protein MAR_029386 [Mya arenaria]|uniref:Uncharacterized protein n=1 Tax=Mya arenaria TaxID=6604 RepID=A0ABY7DJA5_MYAAR|nr:hypothetical protein MAR_029386 [Mya arenaria]